MISLVKVGKFDLDLRGWMSIHYSQPKGFVGRSIIYKVMCDDKCYGAIAGGSATRFLQGRNEFFQNNFQLNSLVNNTFFHIEKIEGKYPVRNFTTKVVTTWRKTIVTDWFEKYGDEVAGFETLVEFPRTGDLYKKDGWIEVGQTKGYTCKRVAGKGTDSWSGKRIWDTVNLRPKRVFCRGIV